MKVSCLALCAMFMSVQSFGQSTLKSYSIKGELKGLSSGKIYMGNDDLDAPALDSAKIVNGKFVFTGKIAEPMNKRLFMKSNEYMQFFLEPGEIIISSPTSSVWEATTKGSKLTDQYNEWRAAWRKIAEAAGEYYGMLQGIRDADTSAYAVEMRAKADAGFKLLNERVDSELMSFVKKYPNSPVSPYVIKEQYAGTTNNPEMLVKAEAALGEAARQSNYGKKVKESVVKAKRTSVGARPSFSMPDQDGKLVSLENYRGKYVLVDFWASWCGPCRKENPNVLKAYNDYHEKGFEIIGISLDDKKSAWLNAVASDKLPWKQLSDLNAWNSELVKLYGITTIPANFLVDPNGVIIARDLRGEALHNKLKEVFKS